MVAPIRLDSPALAASYARLGAQITERDVDRLVQTARADDGRVDAGELADLQRILAHNRGAFTPEAAARLQSLRADLPPPPALVQRGPAQAGAADRFEPNRPAFEGARRDATRVAPRPERAPALPAFQPPRHELRAVPPGRQPPPRENRAAAQARENMQRMAALDPFASRVNGLWQAPDGQWQRVSPSPLELTSHLAFAGSIPGRVYAGAKALNATATAVADPSAANVGAAALEVGLTAGGEVAKALHSPIKQPITAVKATKNAYATTPKAP